MKKLLAFILTFVFLLALIGCNDPQGNENTTPQDTTPQEMSAQSPTGNEWEIKEIVDRTEIDVIYVAEAIEPFYSDENYVYEFACIISPYVIVYYKNGTEENVKVALEKGHITIADLDEYDIGYMKRPKSD